MAAIAVHSATEVGQRPVLVVRIGFASPIRTAGNTGRAAADDDPNAVRGHIARSDRRTRLNHHTIAADDLGDLRTGTIGIAAVDIDRVAVAEAETLEPAIEALGLTAGQGPAWSGRVEHIVRASHDRHVDRVYTRLRTVRKSRTAARKDRSQRDDNELGTHGGFLPEETAGHSLNPGAAAAVAAGAVTVCDAAVPVTGALTAGAGYWLAGGGRGTLGELTPLKLWPMKMRSASFGAR